MKLTTKDLAQLKRVLKSAKDSYYNSGKFLKLHTEQLDPNNARLVLYGRVSKGKVVLPEDDLKIPNKYVEITDAIYDLIEDALKQFAGFEPPVGAPVVGKTKVKLPFKMPSLDKVRADEGSVDKFAKKNAGPYLVSDKLDGVSIEVVYRRGQATNAYTRGDGITGQDISFLVPHLKLPSYNGDLAVRGECIMQKANFAQYADKFRNPRNLTSGILNTKGVHAALKHVEVIVYEVLDPRGVPSTQLAKLKTLGFNVVPHKVVSRLSDELLSSMLKARRGKSKHELDGIVVCRNAKTPLSEDGNPTYAVAFKSDSEGNMATAKVVKVWWQVSKHRMLKPKIEIEPVELAGVDVTYATCYNAAYVRDNLLGPGAVVRLTRSGEVIPKILEVLKPARNGKAQMPTEPCEWNKTNVDLVLLENVQHTGSEVKKLDAFLSEGLGVEYVAGGILAKLHEAGFNTIPKVLNVSVAKLLTVPGIKDTMAQKIYSQIKNGCAAADINKVAANSGFFGNGLGSRRIKLISDKYDLFKLATESKSSILQKVMSIHGFSTITAKQFSEHLAEFINWVNRLPIKFKKAAAVRVKGSKFAGQNVCFTGVRSATAEAKIAEQGGKIASGVNSQTTLLVVKDPGSTSSKAEKARSLGIKIVSLDQLSKMLG